MTAREVVLAIEPMGEPRTGEWCPRCLLPSAIAADYVVSMRRATQGTGTYLWCECGFEDGTLVVGPARVIDGRDG